MASSDNGTSGKYRWVPAFAGMTYVFMALQFFPAPAFCADENPQPQLGIAMHGAPKYKADFTHFDYTNPDAPKGGTFKLGVTGSFDSLNPFIVRGTPPLGLTPGYLSFVYESLMARSWDEPFSLYGLIAESITVPQDRSWVSFKLRPKARWQDGQPITADDVLFSWQTLRDHGRPHMRLYYNKVEKAEKLGPREVKFTFKKDSNGDIDREMPLIMGVMPILPEHDWKSREFDQTSLQLPVVGSGPYKLSAVDPGRSITYQRDPDYWGRDLPEERGMYNFDTIRVDYYRDDNITLEAFKAGAFDWRREANANKWATGYEFPARQDQRVKLERDLHRRTEPAYAFIFNTRRATFNDPALRAALEYSFDFDWINRELFHGQYHRATSFFPNSELTAPALPEGRELEILQKYKAQLPPDIFTRPMTPPDSSDMRANLLKASAMLKEAGYQLRGDQLYTPSGAQVSFEILLADPSEEKLALEWARSLKRLGITASVHTVDSAQYQARLASFDFDVTANRWISTLSPGNEQSAFWGAAGASQPGSRNYAGIKDPVIDALASTVPVAPTREDLVATVHALDRVLMAGHYTIPLYYSGADQIAYWTEHLRHPDTVPLYGTVVESWWYEDGKTVIIPAQNK